MSSVFECEANKNAKYYRVIHTIKEYEDGRRFPLNEIVTSKDKIDLNATDPAKMGGFCISTYEYIFRWLIRGNVLCEVIIPEDTTIYKTKSNNGIYVANKMILTNPKNIDDNFAMELYMASTLPEKSYLITIAVCCLCGYKNTALQVYNDKVNKNNIDDAIKEFEDYCNRRKEEFLDDPWDNELIKKMYNRLLEFKSLA